MDSICKFAATLVCLIGTLFLGGQVAMAADSEFVGSEK